MDEWIVAGDARFLAKAQHRIEAFVKQAGILVLASHSSDICRQWCNKAIWMERGEVKQFGKFRRNRERSRCVHDGDQRNSILGGLTERCFCEARAIDCRRSGGDLVPSWLD